MFHRIGAAAYKADLSNTIELVKVLGNPERKFKTVHIAGTNGKGSTSHILASIFQEAGYKTGLYTSPHLIDFRERIKINGEMIPQSFVIEFVEEHKEQFERIQPSFFEWTVGLAFDYFADQKVDIAVIETGLGGRLDSTNIIKPEVSVITNISFDHQALLGDTIEKIAKEKAGIIKPGIPVVIGERDVDTENVFSEIAIEKGSPIVFASEVFKSEDLGVKTSYRTWRFSKGRTDVIVDVPLKGKYQGKNIVTVLASVELLKKAFPGLSEKLGEGIKNVIRNTGLLGRWQELSTQPAIIVDTGHNEAGIKEILEGLQELEFQKLHWVLGVVNDKDVSKILSMLPRDNVQYYFTKASIPRALDAEQLQEEAKKHGLGGEVYQEVSSALEKARERAKANDLILVGGSTFTVADALSYWKKNFGGL